MLHGLQVVLLSLPSAVATMGSIPIPSEASKPGFLVIGAGSRGHAYARAVNASTAGQIVAVAEPDPFKRNDFGARYIWSNGQPQDYETFSSWQDYVRWEDHRRTDRRADATPSHITGVFVCTLDDTHAEIIEALAPLSLHIMCEKPLALSMADCLRISRVLGSRPPRIFSIGHVLRYSPHNMLLRDLLVEQEAIGEVVSIEHTEPVGWWHFAHSYVRGNWRRATPEGIGSLLTKSCHDIDFLLWLLCSPSKLIGDRPHLPSRITSSGSLTQFRPARKPRKAENATNCANCAAEADCIYSAKKIYLEKQLRDRKNTDWPVKVVVPDVEDIVRVHGWDEAEQTLLQCLAEDYTEATPDIEVAARAWYGRCVFESDNDVVDDQVVTMIWDEDSSTPDTYGRGSKRALLHMTYATQAQCERRGRIYGSRGEITYDSRTITVYTFADQAVNVHHIPKQNPEAEKSHGGGDWGLAGSFVAAVRAVNEEQMSVAQAQRTFIGCDLEECIRSHAVVFAAEHSRINHDVISYPAWWNQQESRMT